MMQGLAWSVSGRRAAGNFWILIARRPNSVLCGPIPAGFPAQSKSINQIVAERKSVPPAPTTGARLPATWPFAFSHGGEHPHVFQTGFVRLAKLFDLRRANNLFARSLFSKLAACPSKSATK
jgi:hypothetical protein